MLFWFMIILPCRWACSMMILASGCTIFGAVPAGCPSIEISSLFLQSSKVTYWIKCYFSSTAFHQKIVRKIMPECQVVFQPYCHIDHGKSIQSISNCYHNFLDLPLKGPFGWQKNHYYLNQFHLHQHTKTLQSMTNKMLLYKMIMVLRSYATSPCHLSNKVELRSVCKNDL